MKKFWLKQVDWETVVATNEALCHAKQALHKATSDGYEQTETLWQKDHSREMTLLEAVELCRKCHRLAPFCNYNGNTFVAIIRVCINDSGFTEEEKALARSFAGHIVAGTEEPNERIQLEELLLRLAKGRPNS